MLAISRDIILLTLAIASLVTLPWSGAGCAGPAAERDPARTVSVTVRIEFGPDGPPPVERIVTGPYGASALTVLRVIAEVDDVPDSRACGSPYVVAVNGVRQDRTAHRYWLYSVNDVQPDVAAAEILLEDGDRVAWRYMLVRAPAEAEGESPDPSAVAPASDSSR